MEVDFSTHQRMVGVPPDSVKPARELNLERSRTQHEVATYATAAEKGSGKVLPQDLPEHDGLDTQGH